MQGYNLPHHTDMLMILHKDNRRKNEAFHHQGQFLLPEFMEEDYGRSSS